MLEKALSDLREAAMREDREKIYQTYESLQIGYERTLVPLTVRKLRVLVVSQANLFFRMEIQYH